MVEHGSAGSVSVWGVPGIGEVRPGDDVAVLIAAALTDAGQALRHGDVVVITSKIISKAEGNLVTIPAEVSHDEELFKAFKRELVEASARRVVASAEGVRITENHLGIIQAASGIDGSNMSAGELAVLPDDPDASAQRIMAALLALCGVQVGVVITDTMGRAWRVGQIDQAIGCAGIVSSVSYAGQRDAVGEDLAVTNIAVIDEIAAAADLVKGKTLHTPVAVVRGVEHLCCLGDDLQSVRATDLIRPPEADLFYIGAAEARELGAREAHLRRRSVRQFTEQPVPAHLIEGAVAAAMTAPFPHHSSPLQVLAFHPGDTRTRLLDEMEQAWREDLHSDGFSPQQIDQRVNKGSILRRCPVMLIPVVDLSAGAHVYRDERRNECEKAMFTAAGGGATFVMQQFLASHGVGSCWIGSTFFAAETLRSVCELGSSVVALGALATGFAQIAPSPRTATTSPPPVQWM